MTSDSVADPCCTDSHLDVRVDNAFSTHNDSTPADGSSPGSAAACECARTLVVRQGEGHRERSGGGELAVAGSPFARSMSDRFCGCMALQRRPVIIRL